MKKNILFSILFCFSIALSAQLKMPQPSPKAKVEQVVGLTDISLEYSRPGVKGRTIYGDLVPYDKIWRTGANKNTMITFSSKVTVEGKELEAGSYAIFTKPGKENWEVIFYSDTDNWGTPKEWDDAKVAAKVMVKPVKIPMNVETFTIMFSDIKMDSAILNLLWENTEVAVKMEFPTKETAMANIQKVLAGPSASDYYQTAVFYKDAGDLEKAKENIEKAVSIRKEPAFWMHRQHSLILAGLGKKEEAIAAAKTSLELAKKAENEDYVKMNEKSLKEWGAK